MIYCDAVRYEMFSDSIALGLQNDVFCLFEGVV